MDTQAIISALNNDAGSFFGGPYAVLYLMRCWANKHGDSALVSKLDELLKWYDDRR